MFSAGVWLSIRQLAFCTHKVNFKPAVDQKIIAVHVLLIEDQEPFTEERAYGVLKERWSSVQGSLSVMRD